jgi:hypothetical protein
VSTITQKCDRVIPACTRCAKLGSTCTYDAKIQKRGRKTQTIGSQPYPDLKIVKNNTTHAENTPKDNLTSSFKLDKNVQHLQLQQHRQRRTRI